MLLSGDDLPNLGPDQAAVLRKMLPPTGQAARFADEQLTVSQVPLKNWEFIYLFNYEQAFEEEHGFHPGRWLSTNIL